MLFGIFAKKMMCFDYNQSQKNHTIFVKNSLGGQCTILFVNVEDTIVIGDDLIQKQLLKKKLFEEFEFNDSCQLKYIQGIYVANSKKETFNINMIDS